MHLWPAIDLRGGRGVRLRRGEFSEETVFGDPVELALAYRDAGADRVHVVDLDAARTGDPVNRGVIERIAATGLVVQAGGGVRDLAAAASLFGLGVARVIVGTAVVEQPALLVELAASWPERVLAGLDHRVVVREGGRVLRELAVRGWVEGTGRDLLDVLAGIEHLPLAGVVVTNISRDGTAAGPDLESLRAILAATPLPVLAAGGVATLADLRRLASLGPGSRRLDGVIAGRSLLSGELDLASALRLLEAEG